MGEWPTRGTRILLCDGGRWGIIAEMRRYGSAADLRFSGGSRRHLGIGVLEMGWISKLARRALVDVNRNRRLVEKHEEGVKTGYPVNAGGPKPD